MEALKQVFDDSYYKWKDYSQNVNLGDMHANVRYVIILPFNSDASYDSVNYDTVPDIVTYKDEETKVQEILQAYKNINDTFRDANISLTFREGRILNNNQTMKDIAKQLKRSNINGLCLCVTINKEEWEQEQVLFIDESCITSYLANQYQSGSVKMFELIVEIPTDTKKQIMLIKVSNDCSGNHVFDQILKQINRDYGVVLGREDVQKIQIKEVHKKLQFDTHLLLQQIYDKSVLTLFLENPEIHLKKTSTKDYNSYLTIFKENQKEPQKFKYSEIADMTFQYLYRSKLILNESEKKKDAVYGLKIMDVIIMPHEKLSKAEELFKNNDNTPLNMIGKVVNEKMIFFYHIPRLSEKQKVFKIQNLKMPESERIKRQKYRDLSRSKAQKTLNDYFKNEENIEPILIYTSELKYEQSPGHVVKIYQSLNRYLRQNSLLTLEPQKVEAEWRYRYASTLLRHLEKIKKYQGLVYRGISYDPLLEKGQIMTFKQFGSTSVSRNEAIAFAKKYKKMKTKHLFEMEIKNGYPIKQYSEFMHQQEVLLEPFSEFLVQSIRQQNIDGNHFKIYKLKQLETSKQLPSIKANFVVWIDTNTKEARKIYDSIEFKEITHLKQLLSTEELKEWLSKHADLLNDPTAKVIFITNMSRKENDTWNGLAGIEGLKQIRTVHSTVPVYFYIGDVEQTIQKLVQNNVDLTGINIGNTVKGIRKYLIKQASGK